MSWETQSWAARQRPGSASAKLVLLGLASCADANHCAFPSIQWLCEFSDLNRKTVLEALKRLSRGLFPLIEDTGDRKGRTRQVKVYRLAVAGEHAGGDPASLTQPETADRGDPEAGDETVPKPEQSQNRNSSDFTRKESQKRDTEPFREPIPPSPPNGGDSPQTKKSGSAKGSKPKPQRLPDDWEPPSADDLPGKAGELVSQWPAGAYEASCEAFACHWHAETGRRAAKHDWSAELAKWLIGDHPKMMRAKRAGVTFGAAAAKSLTVGSDHARRPAPAAQAKECQSSADIRRVLQRELGAELVQQWFANVALLVNRNADSSVALVAIAPSEFHRDWIRDRYETRLGEATREATGKPVSQMIINFDEAEQGSAAQ